MNRKETAVAPSIRIDGMDVPCCGKFEVEWALRQLLGQPWMSHAELSVKVAARFDEDIVTGRIYATAAHEKLSKALDLVWSFNEENIGRVQRNGSTLLTREIQRPGGLFHAEWYRFAGDVCRILNGGN